MEGNPEKYKMCELLWKVKKKSKGREGHGESDSSMGRAIWDKCD